MEMVETNIGEGLGASWLSEMRRRDRDRSAVEGAAPIAVDGRMLPHERLRTPAGYAKTDGVDHHRDHFWPGCVDVAWDLAGVPIELGLDQQGDGYFLSRHASIRRRFVALARRYRLQLESELEAP